MDIWGATRRRDPALSREGPRHRRRRVHQRLPRPGAARGRATTSSASTTSRKYGRLAKSYDDHPRYRFVEGDAKDAALADASSPPTCDQVVAAAAMIGGISYFHEFAYDLMAENERILASTFDAAIAAHRGRPPAADHRPVELDGLRVHDDLPDARGRRADLAAADLARTASRSSPRSTSPTAPGSSTGSRTRSSGRSTASASASAAPLRDTDIMSGNVKLALSHVVPDLVLKVLKGQDPLHILGEGNQVRHYTYGGDLAHGIRHRDGVRRRPSTRTSTCPPPRPRRCWSWPRRSGTRSTATR